MNRMMIVLLSIFLFVASVGCAKDEKSDTYEEERQEEIKIKVEEEEDEKEPVVLHVLTSLTDQEFDQLYGKEFAKQYPNITLKATYKADIWTFEEAYQKAEKKPDVIIFPFEYEFKQFLDKGLLRELDGGAFDFKNLFPPVFSYVEAMSGSEKKIYGIAGGFITMGLKFDKQLFDRYQIDYPTNEMTWEEVFALAKKFSGKEENGVPVYGLSLYGGVSSPFNSIDIVREAYGLTYFDQEGRVMLNSDRWKEVLQLLLDGFRSGYLDPVGDAIATKRAAMYIQGGTMQMQDMDKYGYVTLPVSPYLQEASDFGINNIATIVNATEHLSAAWKLVKFLSSEETASRNIDQTVFFPSRLIVIPASKKQELEPFLSLTIDAPRLLNFDAFGEFDSNDARSIMYSILEKAFKQLYENKLTMNEAIAQIEREVPSRMEEVRLLKKQEKEQKDTGGK